MKNIRRKVANAISPDKSQSYPIVELKWATPQSENRRSLERAHVNFEKEFGRPAIDDAEAWKWDREQLNEIFKKHGEPLARTEFVPEHFFVGEELEEYYKKENTPNSKNQG